MSECSLLRYLYLAYFAQPTGDRLLYQTLRKTRVHSIVELGMGQAVRTLRMFQVLRRYGDGQPLRYTGIDLFEARPAEQSGLKLKAAHQMLQSVGAKVQLVPGDPHGALSRVANTLTGTDLLIISADQDPQSLARAWFYVPRMLRPTSLVLVERREAAGKTALERVSIEAVERLAAEQARQTRRAA